jgi:ribosomal protein L30E
MSKNAKTALAAAAATPPAPVVAPAVAAIGANTARAVIGCKQHIRNLLSAPGAALTLAEICKASGKTEVNVRTMLSDMRNPKYAGKSGVFVTISTRGTDGLTRYSVPAPVVAPVAK